MSNKFHRTSIDLDSETRQQLVTLLNQQLADSFDECIEADD